MRNRVSHTNELIDLLIKSLKNNENLPFKIKTAKCPHNNSKCKKKHGEIVVTEFNKKRMFHCKFYSVHESDMVYEDDLDEEIVRNLISKSLKRKKHARKPLFTLKELEKVVDKSNIYRTEIFCIRCTKHEKKNLTKRAKNQKKDVSDLARELLFS